MDCPADTNAAIWKSADIIERWTAEAGEHERKRAARWRFMAELLPFREQDTFTFLDLGAGTGAASKPILSLYPRSVAILADFSPQMIGQGERELQPFAGRFQYVQFDLMTGEWPAAIPAALDAAVTSLCVHHLPDHRKQGLFREIFERLAPGGWYLNYDPVTSADPVVEAAWERTGDRRDPGRPGKRRSRSPEEHARHENHIRYMIPLAPQLEYLRAAGFQGIDVYWKELDEAIYGGCRPA
jgi:tRNA (cmo5U34)-methyltransferase